MKQNNFLSFDLIDEKYIPSLDGLRAFSILLVIISHVENNYSNSFILKLDLGGFGVSIFFVLSGFLITLLLLKEKKTTGKISIRNFYIRRFFRIIPVAYLYLGILLFLRYICEFHFDTGNIIRAAFLCENFADHPIYTSTTHFWSLSVEEQFYLIFPLLIVKGEKVVIRVSVILFFFTPLIIYCYYHFDLESPFEYILLFLKNILSHGMINILIGCLAAILCVKKTNLPKIVYRLGIFFQICILLIGWLFNTYMLTAGIGGIFCAVSIALFIVSIVYIRDNFLFNFLNLKIVRYIGVLSYSLYIWQQVFCFQQPWAQSINFGSSIMFNLPALFITAILSYHLFEQRFLKLKRRFALIKIMN